MLLQVDILAVLLSAFVIGLSAAAVPPIVRALWFVRPWLERGIKPWACDICMSFWSTLLATLFWWLLFGVPWIAGLCAYVVTLYVVRKNSDPIGGPPGVPDLIDIEEPG